jgi:putative ABC transport system permease protein
VVTESAAKKYFGTTDAIGRTVRINDAKDFIVSAVAKDVPENSQVRFDFVVNFITLTDRDRTVVDGELYHLFFYCMRKTS